MATKDKKSKSPKPKRSRGSKGKTKNKGSVKNFLGGKIKWGEALLFGVLGYEMGNVLQGSGAPEYLYNKYPMFAEAVNLSSAEDSGDFINKLLGLGAGSKVLYDGMAKGKVTDGDLSILLPYTLGTVLDANKKGLSVSNGERW